MHIDFSVPNKNNLLKNLSHVSTIDLESGIYRLNCQCGTKYVGKRSRAFKRRLYQRKYSYVYNYSEKSNFANHLLQPDHNLVPFNNMT